MDFIETLLKCGCIRCGKQPAHGFHKISVSKGRKYITTKSFELPVCEIYRRFFINYDTKKTKSGVTSGMGCCCCIFIPLVGFLLILLGAPGWLGFIPLFIISIIIGIGLISYSVYARVRGGNIGVNSHKYWKFAFYLGKISIKSHISNQFLPLEQWIVERLSLPNEVIPNSVIEENQRIQEFEKKIAEQKRKKRLKK